MNEFNQYDEIISNCSEEEKNDIRENQFYKAIIKYIKRNFDENGYIPIDLEGFENLSEIIKNNYSVNCGVDLSRRCFKLAIEDLCSEGILRRDAGLSGKFCIKLTKKEDRLAKGNKSQKRIPTVNTCQGVER